MESICRLKEVYRALYEFEAKFLTTYGITINEGIILCLLSSGARNAGEICEECSLSTSRLSKVLAMLESKGFVCRSIGVGDRRKVAVSLTEDGAAKVKAMKAEEICIPAFLTSIVK